jgi:hypothetical protein
MYDHLADRYGVEVCSRHEALLYYLRTAAAVQAFALENIERERERLRERERDCDRYWAREIDSFILESWVTVVRQSFPCDSFAAIRLLLLSSSSEKIPVHCIAMERQLDDLVQVEITRTVGACRDEDDEEDVYGERIRVWWWDSTNEPLANPLSQDIGLSNVCQ